MARAYTNHQSEFRTKSGRAAMQEQLDAQVAAIEEYRRANNNQVWRLRETSAFGILKAVSARISVEQDRAAWLARLASPAIYTPRPILQMEQERIRALFHKSEPIVTIHVSKDVSPETLEALGELAQAAIKAIESGYVFSTGNAPKRGYIDSAGRVFGL